MKKFIEELKRRNVIKASLAYLVVAWILLQVFTVLLPIVDAPDWVLKSITLLLAIGLPIWIVISWVYDISQGGIEKTAKVSDNELKSQLTNKRLNVFIIVSLSIAVVVLTLNLFFFSSDSDKRYAIAVLPFEDLNVDKDKDWFSKGLTIDIRTYLSKIENLTIISERSVKEALDSEKTLPEIAGLLNVTHFVGGTISQFKNDIKISVHLTRTSDEKDPWAEIYNRNLDNPFKVQQDVSQKIVEELKVELTPEEEKTLQNFPTENMEAYALFTKGQTIHDSRKKENLELNIELNKQATALDPNFAEAYAEIGQSTFLLGAYYSDYGYNWGVKNAMPYLEKALQLDPDNAMVYGVKGMIISNEGNWEKAIELFERAIELNPNSATIRFQYANHANFNNDDKRNISQIAKGQELNPLSPLVGHLFFANLINNNKIKEAEKYFSKYRFLFTKPGEQMEKESLLIAYKNKDWKAGFRFLETKLKKDPDNAILNRQLGEAYDGILLDDDNYLKYTKKAYELDSTNIDNGEQYYDALLGSENFKEALKLIENNNFKSLFSKSEELDLLFRYYYQKKKYNNVQEVLKDRQMAYWKGNKLKYNARMGNKKYIDSMFAVINMKKSPITSALVYAILKEKDSMYYSLENINVLGGQRQPYRSLRYGFRLINSWKEFDPYRKEERFKAILRKYYLPITHRNE